MMERYLKSTTNIVLWRSCALKHDGEELHSVRMAATQVAPVTAPDLGKLQISQSRHVPQLQHSHVQNEAHF